MAQTYEKVVSRLKNIKAIEPLLGALRTISMGTWQTAQHKLSQMQQYQSHYDRILSQILPYINPDESNLAASGANPNRVADSIVLILGTERGLCGKFNEDLAEKALAWILEQDLSSHQTWVVGKRMVRTLTRTGVPFANQQSITSGDLPTYRQSYLLTQGWIKQFEAYDFNQLFILYFKPGPGERPLFAADQLLPYTIKRRSPSQENFEADWPPPIIETNPEGIYHQLIQHYLASHLYQILLESAVAENVFRFRMMEDAKQNAEDIIIDLNREINAERRRKITQEMQELAVGAGLIDNK
ncbi:MAG: F0F1 ATP synthase subunit gamma [Chloroflexota bacterium]|nr:F0F1 ATP synthase subunit gamma [Chloroflexota bacterium]